MSATTTRLDANAEEVAELRRQLALRQLVVNRCL
jgi:hypothetical protein